MLTTLNSKLKSKNSSKSNIYIIYLIDLIKIAKSMFEDPQLSILADLLFLHTAMKSNSNF